LKRKIKKLNEENLIREISDFFITLDIKKVLQKITDTLEKRLKVERVSIFKKKEDKNVFEFFVFSKGEKELKRMEIPLGKGVVGYAYKRGLPVIVKDVKKDKHFYSLVDQAVGFKTRSILAFPLKLKGRKYGVIELINKKRGIFTRRDVEICRFLSPFISLALENAILFERLENMFLGIIRSFARAVEAKDPYTSGHVERVEALSYLLARKSGLRGENLRIARIAGILHDVGKIGVPDRILRKPDKLTKKEFEIVKRHVIYSKEILEPIGGIEDVIPGIYYHHERYDGKGYPEGRKEQEIPLIARIISIVDAFDAMASDRPYRKALPAKKIVREFLKNKGKQFDPELVDIFLSMEEVKKILKTL